MADLSFCDLTEAQLNSADLRGAQLSGAGLTFADLQEADLTEANFDGARIGWTSFGSNDLSTAKNLGSVQHSAPSVIGIDTIYHSHGNISQEFLRGAGVPEEFITYMKSLNAKPIEFYSCFISYSSKDENFAKELHAKLQAQNIRCWYAPEDLKIGDKFQERIEESIRLYDKLLVVLSENSVNSPWVEREVQAAFEKEQRQGSTVLFPVGLDDAVMHSPRAWAGEIRRTRHTGNFRNWKDHGSFQAAFDRLLRDLKSQSVADTKQPSQQEQPASVVEAQILEALANGSWGPGPITGSGDRLVRVTEIAHALSLKEEVVADSLERLEAERKVMNQGGTLDNPAPYWSILRRW